jgi:hypothetical protein
LLGTGGPADDRSAGLSQGLLAEARRAVSLDRTDLNNVGSHGLSVASLINTVSALALAKRVAGSLVRNVLSAETSDSSINIGGA